MFDVIRKADYFACLDNGFADPDAATLKGIQDGWLISVTADVEGARLLEFGGGYSRTLPRLRDRNECFNVDRFAGADGGPDRVPEQPGINVVVAYMGDFSPELEDAGFDIVFSISVLEHVPDIALGSVFADVARCLRPGGRSYHAVDLLLADEPLEEVDARINAYLGAISSAGLELLEQPAITPPLTFETDFATSPDVQLWRYWRSSTELERRVLAYQVVSLKIAFERPLRDGPVT